MILFISGGVRSGKSSLAEKMALQFYHDQRASALYYIATTKRNNDEEMLERIKRHQASRNQEWTTIEEPYHIDEQMKKLKSQSVLLIDCLTVWSSNVLFSENKTCDTMLDRIEKAVQIAKDKKMTVIFVSNDLNEDLPIQDNDVQNYVYSLEAVHKCTVSHCDKAIQVVAGVPIQWK